MKSEIKDYPLEAAALPGTTSFRPASFVCSSPAPKSVKKDPFAMGLIIFTAFAMFSAIVAVVYILRIEGF